MGKVNKEALKFYQANLRVSAQPVEGRDTYDLTFYFGRRKIGTIRFDGLELASMQNGKANLESVLNYRPELKSIPFSDEVGEKLWD